MPKTRAQKEDQVKILSKKLTSAKSLVFADYRGLTMKQLADLRDKLREIDAEFTIAKNTLLKRANPELEFEGPTAVLLSYEDEISPIKHLTKLIKDSGIGKIKSGFLGQELLDEAKVLQLATLPSKDELRAKTVGVLVAPLQGMVGVVQANLRNLVYALSEIQKMKGGVS